MTGSEHKFMIKHYQGNWWIGDNDEWFGRYPDSLWPHLDPQGNVDGSTFTKAFRVEWFGEVATHALRPCSQMGNGFISSDFGAAHIDDIGEFNGPVVQLHVFSDRAREQLHGHRKRHPRHPVRRPRSVRRAVPRRGPQPHRPIHGCSTEHDHAGRAESRGR